MAAFELQARPYSFWINAFTYDEWVPFGYIQDLSYYCCAGYELPPKSFILDRTFGGTGISIRQYFLVLATHTRSPLVKSSQKRLSHFLMPGQTQDRCVGICMSLPCPISDLAILTLTTVPMTPTYTDRCCARLGPSIISAT